MGLTEVSAPPKSTFWGGQNIFNTHQMGSKALRKKILVVPNSFLDPVGLSESKIAESSHKNAILQKFLHPQNRPFGVGWSKYF